MEKNWHYINGDKSFGPVSLPELKSVLSRMPQPKEVLVWREGFADWRFAGDVSELAWTVPPPLLPPVKLPASSTVSQPMTSRDHLSQKRNDPVGIGGWLLLVAIGQVLGPFKLVGSSLKEYSQIEASLWRSYPITFYGSAAIDLFVLIVVCCTTYLLFKKSRRFPRFFVYQYVASLLAFPCQVIFVSSTLSAYTGKPAEQITSNMTTPDLVGPWIALALVASVWIWYIKKSKRVANTFVEP
jgi:hypothetical protein